MDKKCKIKDCYNNAKVKGYCTQHYLSRPTCKISECNNINLIRNGYCRKHYDLNEKGEKKQYKKRRNKRIVLPKNWLNITLKEKKSRINAITVSKLIIHILKSDPDVNVKYFCKIKLLKLGCKIPKDLTYSCKISGCKEGPDSLNHYVRNFCHRHYGQYLKGIIDENGLPLRELIDKKKYNVLRSPEKRVLSQFNSLIRGIHAIRKELDGIKQSSFKMDGKYDFLTQVNFIEDNLKFIYNPHFILKNVSFLENVTLKKIIGEKKEESAQVILKIDNKKYKGELIRGDESSVFINTDKTKKGSIVLFFREMENLSEFPFECKAYDKNNNNTIQSIRIEEINERE